MAGATILEFRRPRDLFETLIEDMCADVPLDGTFALLLEITGENPPRVLRFDADPWLLSEAATVLQRLYPQKQYEVRTVTLSLEEAVSRSSSWRSNVDG